MHFMTPKNMSKHLEDFDAMPRNGGSLLAEEVVYLLQVGVDSIVVVVVCRKRLWRRECQEDRHSIVHGELCGCGCGCGGYLSRREAAEKGDSCGELSCCGWWVMMTMTMMGWRGSLPNQHRRSGQLKKSARRLQALGKHYVFRS